MRARVFTALALIPPVLAAVFCTDFWPLFAVSLILVGLGCVEINRMIGGRFVLLGGLLHIVTAFLSSWTTAARQQNYQYVAVVGTCSFVLGVLATFFAAKRQKSNFLLDVLAAGWVVGPLLTILSLQLTLPTPPWWKFDPPTLLAIVPLWGGDTAAIFAGKAFGKHLLAPTISPKKTVEGGIANLLACMLVAWGLGSLIGLGAPQSLACGAAAGILGQAGDLFESWVKRRAGLKDSGTILPGHGGIMDRIDSILFTAPAVAAILLFWR